MSKKIPFSENFTLSKGALVESTEGESVPVRTKRPVNPAVAVVSGIKGAASPGSIFAAYEESEKALNELKAQKGLTLYLPVSKSDISSEILMIDPSLIDVSPINGRIKKFLDRLSLADILPSIETSGQNQPGLVRPTSDGRYELIYGSRRLAACELIEKPYKAIVADVPDADVRVLSEDENTYNGLSHYEKAINLKARIDNHEFDSWIDLGRGLGISKGGLDRYKKATELDDIFISLLTSPSDMPATYADKILGFLKKDKDAVLKKAKELVARREIIRDKGKLPLTVKDVYNELSAATTVNIQRPKLNKPLSYKSEDGEITLKHSVSYKGTVKLELNGVSGEHMDDILSILATKLDLKM